MRYYVIDLSHHTSHSSHHNTCIHRIHSMVSHHITFITSYPYHPITFIAAITPLTLLVNLLKCHVHFYNNFFCMFYVIWCMKRNYYTLNFDCNKFVNFITSIWNTASDEFWTKNMYEFLQVIIRQLNVARTDIYLFFSEYNDSRKQDNRNPNKYVDICFI